MAEDTSQRGRRVRPPAGLIYLLSIVVVVGIVIATTTLGLGVRTTYGSGIDASLGAQIQRDFLADQDAWATALSKNDPGALNGRLTGNAIQDVSQQISNQTKSGQAPTVTFEPSSLAIFKAQDPIDPALLIEVQEDGTKTIVTQADQNAGPTQSGVSFHGDYWMRKDSSGHYLIADQHIQAQPASILPGLSLAVAALLWVGAAAALAWRRRSRPTPAPVEAGVATLAAAVSSPPAAYQPPPVEEGVPPRTLIRTFGGLQVHQDATDWANALKARPVTAFVWLRLLVAAILDPNARLLRDELGRQASPGLDRETQLKRMRNLIHQGFRELPPALSTCIVVEPQTLSFDLNQRQVDAVDLMSVSAEVAGRKTVAGVQLARALQAIEASAEVFLPEFETIEDWATNRKATSTELIRQTRELLSSKRLALILLIADSHLEAERPADATAILEPAFQAQPTNQDLRARLINAYTQAGRTEDAAGLQPK